MSTPAPDTPPQAWQPLLRFTPRPLYEGQALRRRHWPPGRYLAAGPTTRPDPLPGRSASALPELVRPGFWVALYTASGATIYWTPSQADILAADWQIMKPPHLAPPN